MRRQWLQILGEEIAAAVVLRPGQSVTAKQLRDFASSHLADFKVPRKIVFLEEIPKGPTGKLQRIGLAQRLGLVQAGENPGHSNRSRLSRGTAR